MWDRLLRFFRSQDFTLENFEIRNIYHFPHNISLLLRHLRGLKYLGLDCKWVDQVLPVLFPSPTERSRHCPKLKTVQLSYTFRSCQMATLLSAITPWVVAEDEHSTTTRYSDFIIVLPTQECARLSTLNPCPGVEIMDQSVWLQRVDHELYSDTCSMRKGVTTVF
ncbi:hypothetical protein BD410DRAFT_645071 [Rickenella mellea]|uniref:F-box domain-containing protein n=1 Tax=Rickenella mellea TaxID=50990 RepID=A0A4Y7PL64_9AGAM|nr:hypothetical protein BD410DRAFT_645071 [Rickenella mellea]